MEELTLGEIVVRILSAAGIAGVLGWEREVHDKPAGLRTNMMVAIGAATVTLVTIELCLSLSVFPNDGIRADPVRAVSGVIGGLGFLGAGAIIQSRGDVRGMTTAATIWVVGGLGVACGFGHYRVAVTAAITALGVLLAAGRLEKRKPDGQAADAKS
ncbi:MgtC/SapB family protein [Alienimonas californiensis]|uniref:Putative Mg(2+) transport ATPase n=1 Tax=Alienimonas californiensis TaxID=2527989 RepID=A0A517P8R2_9PLAN|nr:MgtC/SapB family protein [Alienimonas californiensis]QDT15764.1 putative Mg(2+) transport ATPase [Alienimonas californiensis]